MEPKLLICSPSVEIPKSTNYRYIGFDTAISLLLKFIPLGDILRDCLIRTKRLRVVVRASHAPVQVLAFRRLFEVMVKPYQTAGFVRKKGIQTITIVE
jgi:hypothetical protein